MFRFALCLIALVLTALPAAAEDYTLFDHTTVSNVSFGDYLDPRDDAQGFMLNVTVETFSEDSAVFVPLADDLFEEVFVRHLDEVEANHAMVVMWRPESDDPNARIYGENVNYDRAEDGTWTRVNHLEFRVRESSFGPSFVDRIVLSGGVTVVFYPPMQGYLAAEQSEVLLARIAVVGSLADTAAVQAVLLQFLEEYIYEAMIISPVADGGPERVFIKLYPELSQDRFRFQQALAANFVVEQSSQ